MSLGPVASKPSGVAVDGSPVRICFWRSRLRSTRVTAPRVPRQISWPRAATHGGPSPPRPASATYRWPPGPKARPRGLSRPSATTSRSAAAGRPARARARRRGRGCGGAGEGEHRSTVSGPPCLGQRADGGDISPADQAGTKRPHTDGSPLSKPSHPRLAALGRRAVVLLASTSKSPTASAVRDRLLDVALVSWPGPVDRVAPRAGEAVGL